MEIAIGSEYGANIQKIVKWTNDIRIGVFGYPTTGDLLELDKVIYELNDIIDEISISIDSSEPNISIYFLPEDSLKEVLPQYVPGNWGFVWVHWDSIYQIYEGTILIKSDSTFQSERSHLIREELTQSLGLLCDSYKYPNSIFYSMWTEISQYAPIDKLVIKLLYSKDILPGMTINEVKNIFGITIETAQSNLSNKIELTKYLKSGGGIGSGKMLDSK
jgi:hypothetical protein